MLMLHRRGKMCKSGSLKSVKRLSAGDYLKRKSCAARHVTWPRFRACSSSGSFRKSQVFMLMFCSMKHVQEVELNPLVRWGQHLLYRARNEQNRQDNGWMEEIHWLGFKAHNFNVSSVQQCMPQWFFPLYFSTLFTRIEPTGSG